MTWSEKGLVDLIVSDIRMPAMAGLVLLREIKRISPETSVLLMTAFGSVDTVMQAIKAGAYHYLTKPFKNDQLIIAARHRNLRTYGLQPDTPRKGRA